MIIILFLYIIPLTLGTKPRQENIADLGYRPNCGAGWYDVQGQGVKNDYCRWVGNCGCRNKRGGDCSWWSCALAGSNKPNSPKGEYTEAGENNCCLIKRVLSGPLEGVYDLRGERQENEDCMDDCVYTRDVDGDDYCFSSVPTFPVECTDKGHTCHVDSSLTCNYHGGTCSQFQDGYCCGRNTSNGHCCFPSNECCGRRAEKVELTTSESEPVITEVSTKWVSIINRLNVTVFGSIVLLCGNPKHVEFYFYNVLPGQKIYINIPFNCTVHYGPTARTSKERCTPYAKKHDPGNERFGIFSSKKGCYVEKLFL